MPHPLHRIQRKHVQSILPYLLIALIFTFIGFALGTHVKSEKMEVKPQPTPTYGLNSIIKNQQAIAVGKITQVDGNTLTIVGDDGKTANFKLSPQINIYKTPVASTSAVKASQNKADIQLNKKAIINLTMQGNDFGVGTITYLPDSAQ